MVSGGKLPLIVSPGAKVSATDVVGIPKSTTTAEIVIIAINEDGTALVILGKSQIISIVDTTRPTIVISSIKPLFSNALSETAIPEKNSVSEGLPSIIDVKFGN